MQPTAMYEAPDASLMSDTAAPPQRFNGTAVRFHHKPVKDEEASIREGRPIFRSVEYIEKRTPGDKTNVIDRPASEADKREFAQAYAAWKAGAEKQMSGTPLAMWPPIAAEQVLELQHFGVRTVEELAGMSDAVMGNIGPLRTLREQAKAWLQAAAGHAPISQLQAKLEEKDGEMRALRQQMEEMKTALAKLNNNSQRK